MARVTRKQAERALAAVIAQNKHYVEPIVLDNGKVLSPACSLPVLMEDYDGAPFAIVWEEGPSEWAYRVSEGGSTEEERVLRAQAAKEFGIEISNEALTRGPEPARMPEGVFAEPIYSFVLGLYPV